MSTTAAHSNHSAIKKQKSNSAFSRLVDYADTNRHGVIAMLLLLIGCLGGITVGMGGINHDFVLIMVIASTMLALSMILAVAPMKFIVGTSGVAAIIDIIVLITLAIS